MHCPSHNKSILGRCLTHQDSHNGCNAPFHQFLVSVQCAGIQYHLNVEVSSTIHLEHQELLHFLRAEYDDYSSDL